MLCEQSSINTVAHDERFHEVRITGRGIELAEA
jgi:hypothetical protein